MPGAVPFGSRPAHDDVAGNGGRRPDDERAHAQDEVLPDPLPRDLLPPADPWCGVETRQGIWLSADTELPPSLLAALCAGLADAKTGPGEAGGASDGAAGLGPCVGSGVDAGFRQDGILDRQRPGPALAAFLPDPADGDLAEPAADSMASPAPVAGAAGLAGVSDEALPGVVRGWRRLASWAAAGELAAVAELAARREAASEAAGDNVMDIARSVTAEIAATLTLTSMSADRLIQRAEALRDLPGTTAALAAGDIDMARALVILIGLTGQDPALAHRIEAQVLPAAGGQTTGQLRAALNRALLSADPAAAENRRREEEQQARVEHGPEHGGVTAVLAGRYLPVTETTAAWQRVTALAQGLKGAGAPGSLDQLRAQVYLSLLLGQSPALPGAGTGDDTQGTADKSAANDRATGNPPTCDPADDIAPAEDRATGNPPAVRPATDHDHVTAADNEAADNPSADSPAAEDAAAEGEAADNPAAASRPATMAEGTRGAAASSGLTGTVNVTVPLATLVGAGEAPGDLGGFGPVTAGTARRIAASALGSPAVRWCITLTGPDGQAVGHGCARRQRGSRPGSGWTFKVTATPLPGGECDHQRESAGYEPAPALRHLIEVRNQRCTFPGCRRPAVQCEKDHTVPYARGGRTCLCNLAPLCAFHHKVKHSAGWKLSQPEPGTLAWVTPAGWRYQTGPDAHPT